MFWDIFLSSAGLILAILIVGQIIAMVLPSDKDFD